MPYASDVMRAKRQELGLKLGAFAERLPISYGHYRNVEAGSKPCAIEVFHRIARELDVPVGELIADPPDSPRRPDSDSQATTQVAS